jgi:hypothetical protein
VSQNQAVKRLSDFLVGRNIQILPLTNWKLLEQVHSSKEMDNPSPMGRQIENVPMYKTVT